MKLIFYFQISTNISKSKLFTLLAPWNWSFISRKKHQHVKIEIVYTSDTMKFTYFSKFLPEGQPKPRNLCYFFQKFSPKANLYHEIYIYSSKIPARGPTKPWNLHISSKNPAGGLTKQWTLHFFKNK